MQLEILRLFRKDLLKLSNKAVAKKLKQIIFAIENAESFKDLPATKKLKGHQFAYRIRIQNYRLGLFIEDDVVQLARILPGKDIYTYFP
jgi:mRNA-degrading endonuclease RelE of RelBE toxin-antitoxin system